VFLADDLDAVVEATATRLGKPLTAFVDCLIPPTNLVKLSARDDASKWLVVEDLGSLVRYEINLDTEWKQDTREFRSAKESAGFFFEIIQQGMNIANLSILACPSHLRQRIESMLRS
jgi:hypothetical protein